MINSKQFLDFLEKQGITFCAGVPDSLLKPLNAVLQADSSRHIIAANEGAAVALGIGDYLATSRVPMIYMQNSGLGNAINPLMSLAHPKVYGIPMLLMIGWRGEPGRKDEPQHVHVGDKMLSVLEGMGMPYKVLYPSWSEVESNIQDALKKVKSENAPFALVVPKDFFEPQDSKSPTHHMSFEMTREQALTHICQKAPKEARMFATTGYLGRELYELRETFHQGHDQDFLCIGGMGHTSQVALGYAGKSSHPVYCLDGDGGLLMHMGALPICGQYAPKSFVHILFNNGVHDSVGAQPTIAHQIDWGMMARASGYQRTHCAQNEDELKTILRDLSKQEGPTFIEIKVKPGARKDLGRPTRTPSEQRIAFMQSQASE